MQLCGSLSILWHCLSLGLEWKLTFSSPVAAAEFSKLSWHVECSTFTASSFRIWKSSTGIPSPPPVLFVWCFLRPTWLHIPGCLVLGKWSHHHDYLGLEDLFCTVFCVFLPSLLNILCLLGPYYFCPLLSPSLQWNVPLVSLIILKRSLVFPILLFSSISLHWSLRKAFLSLLAILWNSAFKWVYLSFSPLSLASLLSYL